MAYRIKTMNTILALSLILLVFIGTACDRKGKNIPTFPPTADSRLAEGWAAFESAEYEDAIEGFTAAKDRDASYADAYNGLGWSYARTQDYLNAQSNFSVFMSLVGDDMSKRIDAYAGLATIHAANQADSLAIEWSRTVLSLNSNYEFSHDRKVNAKNLRALVAKSYYNMQEYLITLQEIDNNLEPGFLDGLKSENIVAEVIGDTVIVRVPGVSETPVTGQATLNVTRQAVVNQDTVMVDAGFVDIYSIRSATVGTEYTVHSFDQGGADVIISGNPIPRNGDKFVVDYLYATDYGVYLSRLLKKLEEAQNS